MAEEEVIVEGEAPAIPDIVGGSMADLNRTFGNIERAFGERSAARKDAAENIKRRGGVIEDTMKALAERKLDVAPPKFEPQPFQAPTPQYNPAEAFGSTAATFGLIASLFTKQPLTSALNASAAAMTAFKKRDIDAYDKAFNEWKVNSDYAWKRAQFENDQYKTAIDLMNQDFNKGYAQARMLANLNNDEAAIAALSTDDPMDFFKLLEGRSRLTDKALSQGDAFTNEFIFQRMVMEAERDEGPLTGERLKELRLKSQMTARDVAYSSRGSGSPINQRLLEIDATYQSAKDAAMELPEGPQREAALRRAALDRDDAKASLSRSQTTRSGHQTDEIRRLDVLEIEAKAMPDGPEKEQRLAQIAERRAAVVDPLYAPDRAMTTAFSKKIGAKDAEFVDEVRRRGEKATRDLAEISRLDAALDSGRFKTGVLSEPRHFIAQAMEFVGVDPTEIKMIGDPATADTLESATNRLAASFESKMSRLTNMQLRFIRDSLPNLSRTPEGNRILIEVMKRVADREREAARLADEYTNTYGSLRPKGKPSYSQALEALDEATPIIDEGLRERIKQGSRVAPKSWKEAFKDLGLPDNFKLPALGDDIPTGAISMPADLRGKPDGTKIRAKTTGQTYEKRGNYLIPIEEAPTQ